MSAPLQGTQSAAKAIARVKYTHDAMIDLMIVKPGISQNELAATFGFTVPWISRVMNSDAFLERLALRKADLVDPEIVATIETKMKALADTALDVIHEKIALTKDANLALKALDTTAKSLGYGARGNTQTMQATFVVALPQKAASEKEWAERNGGGMGAVIDIDEV